MSRAFLQAKERQNRSLDELVMDKTKICRSMKLQGTDVRKGRMSGASDVREGRKSVNSVRVRCSGRPEKVGRPVLRGGPDVRKNAGRPMGQGQRKISDPGNLGSKSMRFRG